MIVDSDGRFRAVSSSEPPDRDRRGSEPRICPIPTSYQNYQTTIMTVAIAALLRLLSPPYIRVIVAVALLIARRPRRERTSVRDGRC